DHDGDYVRRYLPELANLPAPHVHTPWKLPAAQRRQLAYPAPLVGCA
ncbi:MAG TPA: FAD-binding domain-containing protein, partial [Trebonia sp.]